MVGNNRKQRAAKARLKKLSRETSTGQFVERNKEDIWVDVGVDEDDIDLDEEGIDATQYALENTSRSGFEPIFEVLLASTVTQPSLPMISTNSSCVSFQVLLIKCRTILQNDGCIFWDFTQQHTKNTITRTATKERMLWRTEKMCFCQRWQNMNGARCIGKTATRSRWK